MSIMELMTQRGKSSPPTMFAFESSIRGRVSTPADARFCDLVARDDLLDDSPLGHIHSLRRRQQLVLQAALRRDRRHRK
jgi:hypothetical protein